MVNYGNSCIYKIVCNDLNVTDCYVGSTTNFNRRKQEHKKCCNGVTLASYNFHVYSFVRQHGGWSNWSMIEVEKYPCNDKRELEKREREWIEKLNATLNMRTSFRDDEERQKYFEHYREENKEKIKQAMKCYRENNKVKIKEYKQQYYNNNKEILKKYREENKERIKKRHQEYYIQNKDVLNEKHKQYFKQYYKENKEKLNQKIQCSICNKQLHRHSLNRHKKNKHKPDFTNIDAI